MQGTVYKTLGEHILSVLEIHADKYRHASKKDVHNTDIRNGYKYANNIQALASGKLEYLYMSMRLQV